MGQIVAIRPECRFDPVTKPVVREEVAQILHHTSFRQSERGSKLLWPACQLRNLFLFPIPPYPNAAFEIRKRLRQYHYEAAT